MRFSTLLFLSFSGLTAIVSGAECDSTSIRTTLAKDQLSLLNNSGKSIVAYVLTHTESKPNDASRTRTYTGVFTGQSVLAPNDSIDVGKADSRPVSMDYVRFADGSTCGNAITDDAKAVIARFAKQASK